MYIYKTFRKSWKGSCLDKSYFSIYSGFSELNQHQEHLTLVQHLILLFWRIKRQQKFIHPEVEVSQALNLIPIFCLPFCMLSYAFTALCTPLLFNV